MESKRKPERLEEEEEQEEEEGGGEVGGKRVKGMREADLVSTRTLSPRRRLEAVVIAVMETIVTCHGYGVTR